MFLFQVSDTDFSLHASYGVVFNWVDDRVYVDDPNPLPVYGLETSLLDKFWSPRNKVNIRHAKESTQNAGMVFHKMSFSLMGGRVGENSTFELWISIKPILQYCYFVINPGEPDIRLINFKPFKEGSKPKRQNTQLEYDITIQELPEHKQKNEDLEVSSQNYKQLQKQICSCSKQIFFCLGMGGNY